MTNRPLLLVLALCLSLLAQACSSAADPEPDSAVPDAGADLGPSSDLSADVAGPAADSSRDTGPFVPSATSIKFSAVHPLPAGEQILYNDWNLDPNAVYSMTPDGKTVTEIFRAFRIWSMGTSHNGDRIAFSTGDPKQAQHYGITTGDAIQHTFLYDVAKQTVSLLADGNINDECHAFAPGDSAIYLCRRYDFKQEGGMTTFKGWRLGRIDLPAATFTFLTPDVPNEYHLGPAPTLDGKTLYFGRIQIAGGKQTSAIMRQALPTGTAELVRQNARSPVLSPDSTLYVFQNYDASGHLYVATLDGTKVFKVAAAAGTEACFSPDGKQIAYTLFDQPKNCSHIEVVKADGSEASAPRRLRDCGITKESITELDWISR